MRSKFGSTQFKHKQTKSKAMQAKITSITGRPPLPDSTLAEIQINNERGCKEVLFSSLKTLFDQRSVQKCLMVSEYEKRWARLPTKQESASLAQRHINIPKVCLGEKTDWAHLVGCERGRNERQSTAGKGAPSPSRYPQRIYLSWYHIQIHRLLNRSFDLFCRLDISRFFCRGSACFLAAKIFNNRSKLRLVVGKTAVRSSVFFPQGGETSLDVYHCIPVIPEKDSWDDS